MELEELIENTLRRKHLEEMMDRPEKEHTPLEGMDNEQIKRFALFLFEENQNKSKQLDEMIARLDEIGKDLKEANKKIDSLTNALLKANSKAEKAAIEYKLQMKEYKKLEKERNTLIERLSLMNTQTYASSKSLKGIDRKKAVKGKHDDKDDFDGTHTAPTSEAPQSDPSEPCGTQAAPATPLSKERPYRKGMRYNKDCVGTPIIHKSDYTKFTYVLHLMIKQALTLSHLSFETIVPISIGSSILLCQPCSKITQIISYYIIPDKK